MSTVREAPRHRRCTRYSHHSWVLVKERTSVCWSLWRCKFCDATEIS